MLVLAAGGLALRQAAAQSPPAHPSNPRVGIRLEKVTCVEALSALEHTTGVSMRLQARSTFPDQQSEVERKLQERASFDWSGANLRVALDQLGARYHLIARSGLGGQLVFHPAYEAETTGIAHPASQIEVGGYRIGVVQTRTSRLLTDRLDEGDLNLILRVEPVNGDVETLAGLEDVSAVDDRGTRLAGPERPFNHTSATMLPGRWEAVCALPGPVPQARKLASLRGNLVIYRRVTRYRAEFSLPLTPAGRKWRDGGLDLELLSLKPGRTPVPTAPAERQRSGPKLTAQLRYSGNPVVDQELFSPYNPGRILAPLLYGTSGRSYSPLGAETQGRGNPVRPGDLDWTYELTWIFPVIEEPVTRVVFQVLRKEQPDPVLSFHLKDVPLPLPDPSPTRRPYVLTPARLEAGHAFYQQAGARLVSPVQVAGRSAPAGTLHLGLSPCTPRTARGSEWFEAEVGAGGTARLPNLAPGTYRVLRIYRPANASASPSGGVWRGAECVVQVPERGDVALPVLSWHAQAAPTPRELQDRAHPVQPEAGEGDEGRIELRDANLTVLQQQTLLFLEKPLNLDRSSVSVTVSGATGSRHSSRLCGLRNIVARDDRGALMVGAGGALNQSHRLWNARLNLPPLAPQVKRLDWIEGDLHAWTREEPVRVELPIPRSRQTFRRASNGVSLDVTLSPGAGDDELKKPEEMRPSRGVGLKALITAPSTLELLGAKGASDVIPVLVTASGAEHPLESRQGGTERGGDGTRATLEGAFPALDEPVTHVRFDLLVKSEPRKVGAFRAVDVAVPQVRPPAPIGVPVPARPEPRDTPPPGAAQAPSPLFDPRGGTLVQQVRIDGRPVSGGSLSLGLLREGTPGARGIRWVEIRVSPEGSVRLDGVKPGVYQVDCKYAGPNDEPPAGKGRWINARARIRVLPGKPVLLPSLEWKAGGSS